MPHPMGDDEYMPNIDGAIWGSYGGNGGVIQQIFEKTGHHLSLAGNIWDTVECHDESHKGYGNWCDEHKFDKASWERTLVNCKDMVEKWEAAGGEDWRPKGILMMVEWVLQQPDPENYELHFSL